MLAHIHEAHPNFGQTVDVSQTMARFAASPFEQTRTRTNRPLAELSPVVLDTDVAQFIRPRTNIVENMTLPTPADTGNVQTQASKCTDARRHWNTCTKCRRREFFMVLLEMIAYILTGILIIFAMNLRE